MNAIDLKSLIARLDRTSRQTLEAAAALTLARTNYNVEVEHWLLKLLEGPGDLALLMASSDADPDRLQQDINASLDRLKTGSARPPALSPEVVTWAQQAWLLASLQLSATSVRPGHLVWALLSDDTLARRARGISDEFSKLTADMVARHLVDLPHDAVSSRPEMPEQHAADGGEGALDRFTIDLTASARAGKIDPVLGRDAEIRQLIDILTRRRQNNPILTGEAGVGKTAVVEGFALRIAAGDVPEALRNTVLRTLDLGLLQAGAGVKGEFENRLRGVIDEVKASPQPVILFIDEAHQLIGSGGSAGQGDAANLLKPALARGELRTIAATTWAEYKKYFEKDAALTRRFQTVKVEEPSIPVATAMVRGLVTTLEKHHKVRILDEAVEASVKLSARYIQGRQLPDKAVSLIDTACARVGMSQSATPAAIEDRRRRMTLAQTEAAILTREQAGGVAHEARIADLDADAAQATTELAQLEQQWESERTLVGKLLADWSAIDGADPGAVRDDLAAVTRELCAVQGRNPLIFPLVDAQAVAQIVENWTGIPAGRMQTDEIRTVLDLKGAMEKRVVGQPHALEAVAEAIRTSRARLTDPRKPVGVFLMVGSSGVGKTETALTLAELLYGGEQNATVINMSEFKEEHKVSLLMGSPPGYVGYGEGGVLTEAVRRRPYSVVLLDEMEKAHPGVQDVFYQVFDKGTMTDGEGREIDFKNTVIVMTSNAGTDLIARLFADPTHVPDVNELAAKLRPELTHWFRPAFLGRVTLVPYLPLSEAVIRQIVVLQLGRIAARVRDAYAASFDYDPALVDTIAARSTESASGARNIESILSRTLLPELSTEVLLRMADGAPITAVTVGLSDNGSFTYAVS